MIIEILEGHVTQERWDNFEQAYRKCLKNIPLQCIQNFLIQDIKDKTLWRIISIWKDEDSLNEAMSKLEKITCTEVYHLVDVEPSHRIFRVRDQHMHV